MKPVVVFDLDSTLANTTQRQYIIEEAREAGREVDWTAYSLACDDDVPFPGPVKLARLLFPTHHILIVTGRSALAQEQTVRWLYAQGIPFNELIMRGEDVTTSNEEFKVQTIQRWLSRHGQEAPELIIEDWPPSADHLEAQGWTVMLFNPDYRRMEDMEALLK